jgi:sulfonate transport system substrate-binding protein
MMLQNEGMTLDDIQFVNLSSDNARTALAAKSVDAIVIGAINSMDLIDQGYGEVVVSTKSRPEMADGGVGLVRRDYAEKYPHVVKAYIKALIRASEYAAGGHQDELRELLIRGGQAARLVDRLYPKVTDINTSIEVSDVLINELKNVNQFLFDNKVTTSLVDVDSWYARDLYEEAYKELKSGK